MALAALGRLDDVNRVVDEALTVKFRSGMAGGTVLSVMTVAALELRSHGHREASIRMAERTIAWTQTRPPAEAAGAYSQERLMWALEMTDRWAEAKTIGDALLAKSPDDIERLGEVGWLAAHLGDTAQARQIAAKLRDRKPDCDDAYATFERAKIAAQLGEKREAMALLKDAASRGYKGNIIDNEPGLEPLWGDPEFKEFIRPKG